MPELTALDVVSNPDAQVWTEYWLQTIEALPDLPKDRETMVGWFANAIQAGANAAERRLANPITKIADEVHLTAIEKGFYEMPDEEYLFRSLPMMFMVSDIIDMLTAMRKGLVPPPPAFRVDPSSLDNERLLYVQKLLLLISECVEAFQELAQGNETDEAFEVADIAIRLFDYAAARGIDLDAVVAEKMEQNEGRPRKHGARF